MSGGSRVGSRFNKFKRWACFYSGCKWAHDDRGAWLAHLWKVHKVEVED